MPKKQQEPTAAQAAASRKRIAARKRGPVVTPLQKNLTRDIRDLNRQIERQGASYGGGNKRTLKALKAKRNRKASLLRQAKQRTRGN